MSGEEREGGTGVLDRYDERLKEPRMHRVVLVNDDFTPQDFVVELLQQVFHHPAGKARSIMLDVHTRGRGIAGRYTAEIAETKVEIARDTAKKAGHPLEVTHEPE